jgi:hypothetical protein
MDRVACVVDALAAAVSRSPRIDLARRHEGFTLYELAQPFSATPADVILGFVTSDERPIELSLRLVGPGLAGHPGQQPFRCRVSRDDGLVPALMGVTMLPMVALPDGWGLEVEAHGAGAGASLRAVCAYLHNDVVLEMAHATYLVRDARGARVLARSAGAACMRRACVGSQAADALLLLRAVVVLPDLDAAIERCVRGPAARARAAERHGLLFRELMERAWAPERVRAGLVDLDS